MYSGPPQWHPQGHLANVHARSLAPLHSLPRFRPHTSAYRYTRTAAAAQQYVITQFGLSCFKRQLPDGPGGVRRYTAATFNFYVFPRPAEVRRAVNILVLPVEGQNAQICTRAPSPSVTLRHFLDGG